VKSLLGVADMGDGPEKLTRLVLPRERECRRRQIRDGVTNECGTPELKVSAHAGVVNGCREGEPFGIVV